MFNIDEIFIDKEEINSIIDDARDFIAFMRECLDVMSDAKDTYKVMQAYNCVTSTLAFFKLMHSMRNQYIAIGRMLPEIKQKSEAVQNWLNDECPHPAYTTHEEVKERERDKQRTDDFVNLIKDKIQEASPEYDILATNLH